MVLFSKKGSHINESVERDISHVLQHYKIKKVLLNICVKWANTATII